MRVLGIDPGLTRCGVGVVEGVPGRPCKLIAYYVVYTDPDDDLALRLLHLDRSLADLVAEHQPESVAVERVFSQHNVRTVMGTAQASAVAILAGARAGLPVQTYTPSEVKAAVTGSGTAGKAQVTAMVTRLLRLDAPPQPGRRRRRAGPGHLPHLARRHPRPDPGRRGRPPPAGPRRSHDDRQRARRGRRGRPGQRRDRGRRGRPAGPVRARAPSPGCKAGAEARLATSLVVREDSLTLYGFADDDEKQLFELLQTASGVGPRLAQAVLAVHQPDAVRRAIAGGDLAALTRVPGHRQEGRRAAGPGAARPDRPGRRSAPTARPACSAAPGRSRCARACSRSAGRPRRPTRRWPRWPRRSTARSPPVPVLLRQAIRLLGRTR